MKAEVCREVPAPAAALSTREQMAQRLPVFSAPPHQSFSDKDFNSFFFLFFLWVSMSVKHVCSPQINSFFSFLLRETSYNFQPRQTAAPVLQTPHSPTASLSSIPLYLIYCLLVEHMGNMQGKHASGFMFRINTFYDYSHDLQQQTRLVTHNYV